MTAAVLLFGVSVAFRGTAEGRASRKTKGLEQVVEGLERVLAQQRSENQRLKTELEVSGGDVLRTTCVLARLRAGEIWGPQSPPGDPPRGCHQGTPGRTPRGGYVEGIRGGSRGYKLPRGVP